MPRFVMKLTLKFILTISLMAISVIGYATEGSVRQICNVFTSADVQPLGDILDTSIEISILGESVVCNKDYAILPDRNRPTTEYSPKSSFPLPNLPWFPLAESFRQSDSCNKDLHNPDFQQ